MASPKMVHKQNSYRQFWKDIDTVTEIIESAGTRLEKAAAYYDERVKEDARTAAAIRKEFDKQLKAIKDTRDGYQTLQRRVDARWRELAAAQMY